ncbi:MAG: glycine--tRNA ligase subunit beta, partial [Xanthomonadales bacterium]|nr:glycine--tRNA ligase subunit beta [Xanthomonadales bacterium]
MNEQLRRHEETADLLIELGCEELPPKALDDIREAFFNAVQKGLESSHLDFTRDGSRSYSSPRRLAIMFRDVASRQPDQEQERRGPALGAAFDADGKPTGAALGFARSINKEVSELETLKTDQGQWLHARIQEPGKSLGELIYPILEQAIKALPVPRPMRWADHDFSFVRPVHWIVVMHGDHVIEGRLLGQPAANLTRGHRVHSPGPHCLPHSTSYESVLMDAYVVADQDRRKSLIRESLMRSDPQVHIDPDLLNEV